MGEDLAQGIGCDLLPSVCLPRSSAYESRLLEGVSREALMIRSRWSLGVRARLKMSPAGASGRERA